MNIPPADKEMHKYFTLRRAIRRLQHSCCALFLAFPLIFARQLAADDALENINAGDLVSARREIDSLIAARGESPSLLLAKAQCFLESDSAVALYRRIFAKYPRDPAAASALLRLAQYHAVCGEAADVALDVSFLRARFPGSSELRRAASLTDRAQEKSAAEKSPITVIMGAVPQPTANEPLAAPDQDALYAVQLGAFGVRRHAEAMRKRAMPAAKTEVVERTHGGKTLFVVLAGSYRTKEEASAAALLLARKTGTKGFVVQR